MKNYLSVFLSSVVIFFTPLFPIMLSVGLMTIVDTYFGIKASKKRGEEFSSRKLRKGWVSKNISYQTSLVLLFIIDNFVFNDLVLNYFPTPFIITKLFAVMLILIEFSSLNESSEVLYKKSFKEHIREQLKSIFNIKRDINDLR
jgi:hypothetical protein